MGNKAEKQIKKAILFVNVTKSSSLSVAEQIRDELSRQKIETEIFTFKGKHDTPPQGEWDIGFSIGGDGTVLYTARCLSAAGVPILPVNLGSFGFIAGTNKEGWLAVFEKWLKGEIAASCRMMLDISVERDSNIIAKKTGLNDAIVSTAELIKLIKLDVCFKNDLHHNSIGSYRCDGLIIATPTGSTAYSMSAGGPVVDPEMQAIILNPICPFAMSNRPFVLPSAKPLVITVAGKQRAQVLLTVDGQDTLMLQCGDKIYIQHAEKPAKLIFSDENAYYSMLKTKLFWYSEHPTGGDGSNA